MGSSNTDYKQQIDTGLAQANLPKSPLAQQYSNLFGNSSPQLMNALMNVQSLGNSFINSNGAVPSYQPPASNTNGGYGAFPGSGGGNQQQNNNAYNQLFQNVGNHQANVDMSPGGGGGFFGFSGGDINAQTPPQIQNTDGGGQVPPGNQFSPSGRGNDTGGGWIPQGGWQQVSAFPNQPISSSGSSVNTQNGLPSGVNIPDLITAFQGNPGQAIGGLGNAVGNSNSMLQQILGMNPGSLQGIGQNNGANLSMNNPMQQIQQLLSGVGGGYQNVQTPNVSNPNFLQQLLQPQNVNSNFNPQMANPGNVNTNFNPTQANLANVPNSTQLTPQNSQGMDAITQILNQQNTKNLADIREQALQQGTTRSTGEQYGEAQYRAQEAPQLAVALENVRNQEVGNQLNQANLQQTGLLANAGMQNQYGLGGAQLGASTQLQNIQNYLNSVGQNNQAGLGAAQLGANTQLQNVQNQMNAGNLNNLTALQARGQDVGTSLANASNAINVGQGNQAAGLNNQNQNYNLLNQLLGNQTNQNSLNLQNFFQTIGANQNQMGINNQYSNSNVSANNSLASLLSGLNQFNAQQGNQYNLATGGMNQQASQFGISNQLAQLASLFGQGTGMAAQGIPGGSANINIGNSAPQGGGAGGTLGGIGALLQGLGSFRQ